MIIGVTGGIASGKSTVCRILEERGFFHIDADDVAHDILEVPEIIGAVTAEFGNEILDAPSDRRGPLMIDRKKLGKIVFADPAKMDILENITHPEIVRKIKDTVAGDPDRNYVIEAIALISSGIADICDEVWVVHAEPEQQIRRLVETRHLTPSEAQKRLDSQKDHDWDEAYADRVIYSTEPVELMRLQIEKALESVL